jgi:NADH dehydrogenase FAD-containing subunit
VIAAGARDVELASAALPRANNSAGSRHFVLLPGPEHLHVYADGQILMSLPRSEAEIPALLQFAARQAKVILKNVRARKASPGQQENR